MAAQPAGQVDLPALSDRLAVDQAQDRFGVFDLGCFAEANDDPLGQPPAEFYFDHVAEPNIPIHIPGDVVVKEIIERGLDIDYDFSEHGGDRSRSRPASILVGERRKFLKSLEFDRESRSESRTIPLPLQTSNAGERDRGKVKREPFF